jgi:acyl-CoA thioesterase II
MADRWNDLLACLDLTAQPAQPAESDQVFEGRNQGLNYYRLFGGQLLAQFVQAARLAVPGKAVKSLHVLFPRAGRDDEPVRYELRRHHDGGTFATVSIVARQAKGVLATASVSLHAPEDGRDHQSVPEVPAVPGAEHRVEVDLLPWDTRTTVDLDATAPGPPELELWMRTPTVDPEFAPALAAYATDLTIIGTALRPLEGLSQHSAGDAFTSAVTGHTLWFHRPFRTDQWMLLRQHAPLLAGGRCFGRGDVLTEDGALVASYAQESMVRFKP